MGKQSVLIDMTGKTYNYWTVLKRVSNIGKVVRWECKCKCGKIKIVRGQSIRNGDSKSCGCKPRKRKHGLTNHKLYLVWSRMKGCTRSTTHQDYKYYGERGINICDEWYECFETFYNWSINNGYEEGLEIDRIDNNGNYEPDNCRWVTRSVNLRNTRNTVMATLDGNTKPLIAWCEELNLSYNTIYSRIYNYGWSEQRALTEEIL